MRLQLTLICLLLVTPCSLAQERLPTVQTEGGLQFAADDRGNRMPDYSYCGYELSESPLPSVPTRLRLEPSGRDDTAAIQAALDALAKMQPDPDGWRGALELAPGEFHVSGSIVLNDDHVVLRGSRSTQNERLTTIVATGQARRALLRIGSNDSPTVLQPAYQVKGFLPLGSRVIKLDSDQASFSVGQTIAIEIQSTKQWIGALGMDKFPTDDGRGSWLDWKPGSLNQTITRTIRVRRGNEIELDAPLMLAIDSTITPVEVRAIDISRVVHQIGVEHVNLISQADRAANAKDEEHAWDGVRVLCAFDVWIRNIGFRGFAGSAVRVNQPARRVTVVDCASREPVSEDAGWRRRTFVTAGEQTLFLRCSAADGRQDFCTESLASGPNAFVYCRAERAGRSSGTVGSWCSGVLYDNVEIDGAGLELTNFETDAQGIGWTAANCTLWNCVAPKLIVRRPALAYNWAVGVWGEVTGDGLWAHLNEFVSPESLYEHQLAERIGKSKAKDVMQGAAHRASTTGPTKTELFRYVPDANQSVNVAGQRTLTIERGQFKIGAGTKDSSGSEIRQPLHGTRMNLSWWRGSVLPDKLAEFGPGLTRFVPGHDELFTTDELSEVIDAMQAKGHVAVNHHWGLWYDRRRDDHQMVRRLDGEAWPPFYEHPWSRSGVGTGYDGLSKYDLTRFNPWYFGRLKEFARLADQRGVILVQHMYFQHNILEAGAHWAEFPWRPANCLQATGFPEPPVYQNRKRVFMADDFYDVSHPLRRDLHTRYIRHCLDEIGSFHNVLFVLGEEFTGPAHFMRFWLETIGQWQRDTGRDVNVVLSATRDVQEEMLKDPKLNGLIDAVEIKYWWYTKEGPMYDPAGGQNLAPRQQLREWKGPKARSPESTARSIEEVKARFPDKVVFADSF